VTLGGAARVEVDEEVVDDVRVEVACPDGAMAT